MVLHLSLGLLASCAFHSPVQAEDLSQRARATLNWAASPETRGASNYFGSTVVEEREENRFHAREFWLKNSVVVYHADSSKFMFLRVFETNFSRGKNLSVAKCSSLVREFLSHIESPYSLTIGSERVDPKDGDWIFEGTVNHKGVYAGDFSAEINPDTGVINRFAVGNAFLPPLEAVPSLNIGTIETSLITELASNHSIADIELGDPVRLELFNPFSEQRQVATRSQYNFFSLPEGYVGAVQSHRNSYWAVMWLKNLGEAPGIIRVTGDPTSGRIISILTLKGNSSKPRTAYSSPLLLSDKIELRLGGIKATVTEPEISKTFAPVGGKYARTLCVHEGKRVRVFGYDEQLNRLRIKVGRTTYFGRPNLNLEREIYRLISKAKT